MELCLASVQINVVRVSRHIQRLKMLYLLAFCLIDKEDVFGNMCAQLPQNSINLFPVTRRMQGNPVVKWNMEWEWISLFRRAPYNKSPLFME